jgi:hypothetical protein
VGQALHQFVVELEGDDGLVNHAGNVLGNTDQILLGSPDFAQIGQGLHGVRDHPHVTGHGRERVGQHLDGGIAVLHRRLDLHGGKLEHQHGFAHLAPVQVRHVGAGAARQVCLITHRFLPDSGRKL